MRASDKNHTPIIDEEVASNVVRIFELYASGVSPNKIAGIFNDEGILAPSKYAFEKLGFKTKPTTRGIWNAAGINVILNNIIYLGHMPQLRSTTVSYKNHKFCLKDQTEWAIVYNTHEPIISQELWDKVRTRQKSVAHGRRIQTTGYVNPLSGFLFCADCGGKMKMNSKCYKGQKSYNFNCGDHMRYGRSICFSHYIPANTIEEIVLDDIRTMAQRIVFDEDSIRKEFMRQNAELEDKALKSAKKELQAKRKRTEELSRLMQIAYEDRMKGKIPEEICVGFLQKYSDEQKMLAIEIADIEAKLTETKNKQQSTDDFIQNIKKYLDAPELTREMCYELIDRIIVGGLPQITGKERTIDIIYKVDISSVLRYKFQK